MNSPLRSRKETAAKLAAAFAAAFVFLALCSKDSFLYPMNDWVDVNCFMTVGRGMLGGKLVYVDLIEQKGPLLYFLYTGAAAVSKTSFIGIFVPEVICYALFLFFTLRIAELYTGKLGLWGSLALMAAAAFAVTTEDAFAHGGSVEGLALPLMTYSLLCVLRSVRSGKPVSGGEVFLIGCFFACALWVKFTLCGFYFGLCVFIASHSLARKERRAHLLIYVPVFLAGAAAVTAPILVYFTAKGALGALFDWYFVKNLAVYSFGGSGGFLASAGRMLLNWLIGSYRLVSWNTLLVVSLLPALYFAVRRFKTHRGECLAALLPFLGLMAFTFPGDNCYVYYSHSFGVFIGLGAAAVIKLARSLIRGRLRLKRKLCALLALVFAALLPVLALAVSSNTYLLKYKRDDMPQYRFAKIIAEVEDPSLLNYHFLDGGFYFASGAEPACRFFCELNLKIPEIDEEQRAVIGNRSADFIVTRDNTLGELGAEYVGYTLADKAEFYFENEMHTYYLYKLSE